MAISARFTSPRLVNARIQARKNLASEHSLLLTAHYCEYYISCQGASLKQNNLPQRNDYFSLLL
jgi:hypothetical protein